ncbi:hypothetical protein FRY97_21695 [Phaeodactylibacter luteus]|uniref:Uncharacterized protein n=1 Tax=Phaeodactylibacter luteus TaxID=1564516 RepID=A0A5C6RH28_9BACT|nr:hypothetical protein FRY97_21695 [Phaeodactylibacter luteus]
MIQVLYDLSKGRWRTAAQAQLLTGQAHYYFMCRPGSVRRPGTDAKEAGPFIWNVSRQTALPIIKSGCIDAFSFTKGLLAQPRSGLLGQ